MELICFFLFYTFKVGGFGGQYHLMTSCVQTADEDPFDMAYRTPSHLEDAPYKPSVSSSTGGDYTIPVNGHCLVSNLNWDSFGQGLQNLTKDILERDACSLKLPSSKPYNANSDSILKMFNINIAFTYDTKKADSNTAKVGTQSCGECKNGYRHFIMELQSKE